MASTIGDTARKLVSRAETVVGDDVRGLKEAGKREIESDRDMYRYYTGAKRSNGNRKSRKPTR
jgi:hypothetical protein